MSAYMDLNDVPACGNHWLLTDARTNNTAVRDAMFASGAQLLSTDYPINEPARWDGHFVVSLPGNASARCNPVNAQTACNVE
jgi:hypothetical protein